MTPIGREQIAGEEIERLPAALAVENLHPEERFHRNIGVAVERTGCSVVRIEFSPQGRDQTGGGVSVGRNVEVFDFFADNPGRHGIDVETLHIAANPICLDQAEFRPPMKGSAIRIPARSFAWKKASLQTPFTEFREYQAAKQGSRRRANHL